MVAWQKIALGRVHAGKTRHHPRQVNDKHLTVKRPVGLDNHGSPPMTPTYVQRPTFRGRRDSTITGIR
jgi:hypothetical protein